MVYTYIIKHKKKPRFPEGGGKGCASGAVENFVF